MSRLHHLSLRLLAALLICAGAAGLTAPLLARAAPLRAEPSPQTAVPATADPQSAEPASTSPQSDAPESAGVPAVAPLDVPLQVASGNIEEWTAGQGLLYWAYNCFADEFNTFAELRRKPVSGQINVLVESINDGSRCATYQNMLSASDGLYYYSYSQSRIEHIPLSEPFTPQVVKALPANQAPNIASSLKEGGNYLYWVHPFSGVYRTLKDGSGPVETVATTANSAEDVLVVGTVVYWTDSTGVWAINNNCGALPCNNSKTQYATFGANTGGYGLLFVSFGGFQGNYRLYWVQRTFTGGSSYSYLLRYKACDQISTCIFNTPVTYYTPTANWLIGSPAYANNLIYWTERDVSAGGGATGDVKRKVRNDANPGAETIATGQAGIDRRLFVANDLLFFARRGVAVYSLPLSASAITRDFTAVAMEVTQAIQNLANAAPLVANKTTYVRAYGTQLSGPSTPNVEARLAGSRLGVPLPGSPLAPVNGVRSLQSGAGYDRGRLSDGWYFLLPASWITPGQLTLQFEVDPRRIHTDPNLADNSVSRNLSLQDQPPICVMTVPVRTHTPLPSTNDPNFMAMVTHFDRRWPAPTTWIYRDTSPVEELQVCTWYGLPYPCFGPYELDEGWGLTNGIPDRDKVIASLWTQAQLTFNPDACDDIGAPVHFMGLVHPDANTAGVNGYASLYSNQSWVKLPEHNPNPIPEGWNNVPEGAVMAQELAHNYGRQHVNCGNPEDPDSSYPYPPCQISNTGAGEYYGFDTRTLTPIGPTQAADFMSYATNRWVSDYTWRALVGAFAAGAPAAATAPAGVPGAIGDSVFATGWLDTVNNRGKLVTVLLLPTASIPPATRAGAGADAGPAAPAAVYRLRLIGPNGEIWADRFLTPLVIDDHSATVGSALFSDAFTPPAGQVAKVELLSDNTVLDSRSFGVRPPTVTIVQPAGGAVIQNQLTIQWSAIDPDLGDRLIYTVQYSHDGGARWTTIASDYPGTPGGGTLTLSDLGSLAGGLPNGSLVRVLASDGYNTGVATSQPFTLQNRTPDVYIGQPVEGQIYPAGEAVGLSGSATDAEDGGLGSSALSWKVDNVAAGSGPDVIAAGLAPGAHTATLTATDSGNHAGTAAAHFTVAPLSVPVTSFLTLDGNCNDGGYAGAATVPLAGYGDGSQASLRLIRTSTQLWACFSGLKNGTPAPGAIAGLAVDVNHSGGAAAQPSDYAFYIGENGSVSSYSGNGAGGFASAGPGGVAGQMSAGASAWSGELRIDMAVLGGWDHFMGLMAGHFSVTGAGNNYVWPFRGVSNQPATWATTALGLQPVVEGIAPFSAIAGSAAFTLTVTGSNFSADTVVLWKGGALPTTFVDAGRVDASVGAAQVASPGTAAVNVRSQAPNSFESNAVQFQITAPPPVVTSLSPAQVLAGSGTTPLTVNGSGFGADTQVLWNGQPLATQFVNATRVIGQITPGLLVTGQTVSVSVRSTLPQERLSNELPFVVAPQAPLRVYLPRVLR